jgi:hypothetical protein
MKPEQLYQELKALADKLSLQVMEQNFRTTGIPVKSGYCKVKDIDHCIINKHLKTNQKMEILAECLSRMPLESIYIIPAVREYLDQFVPAAEKSESFGSENQGQSSSD